MKRIIFFIFLSLFIIRNLSAQYETTKWYFGNHAALDFMTSPPTIISPSSINTLEGCASIADAAGNLLFYTDGITIWDQTHSVMTNGTGLTGDPSTTQSAVIVKKPGSSTIYYVFTLGASGGGSLCVSTVDKTLSGGNGAVTIKNTSLAADMSEKLTSVQHCNGKDVWVLSHESNSNKFFCFLVSAAGVSLTPVVSAYGPVHTCMTSMECLGAMKISPDGRRIGMANLGITGSFELYDFNNSTGIVSNSLTLLSKPSPYGCEFSPDGSKFYGTSEIDTFFYQWDLCAGSANAIAASIFTLGGGYISMTGIQSAPDGKIYIARPGTSKISVINSPNLAGPACNFVVNGLSLTTGTVLHGLPNFINSFFKPPLTPFTFTSLTCGMVKYTSPVTTGTVSGSCVATTYSNTGLTWNFGDPTSGILNTSALNNPSHTYLTPGNYTTQLIIHWPCRKDTFQFPVTASSGGIVLSVAGKTSVCVGEQQTYTVSGANNFTWTPTINTATRTLTPNTTTTYTVAGSNGGACITTHSFTIVTSACSGISEYPDRSGFVTIYPNPIAAELSLECYEASEIIIYNSSGKKVFTTKLETGQHRIYLSELADGIYIMKVINRSGTQITRIVKTNQ